MVLPRHRIPAHATRAATDITCSARRRSRFVGTGHLITERIGEAHVRVRRCGHERIALPLPVRGRARCILVATAFVLLPTISNAQESTAPLDAWPASLAEPQSPSSSGGSIALDDATVELRQPTRTVETGTLSRRGALLPLYASFATLQALDGHSTLRALRAGGEERNPLLRGIADRPAALYAVKAGVTASTILLIEKLRVKNRTGAIVLMAALNSVYSVVVAHNYQAVR